MLLGAIDATGGELGDVLGEAFELSGGAVGGMDGDADLGASGVEISGGTLGGIVEIGGVSMGEK